MSSGDRRERAVRGTGVVTSLKVELAERSYPIYIGTGTLARAGAEIARRTKASRVALVTVPEVGRHYAGVLTKSLRAEGPSPWRRD